MGSFTLLREAATRSFFVARVIYQTLILGPLLQRPYSCLRLVSLHLFQVAVIMYTHITMYLDTWIYGDRLPEVGDGRNMLFITGLPRTGSTFLQRQFSPEALNAPNLSFTLWELMFPSLSGRAIAKFLRADRWIGTFYKGLSTGTTVDTDTTATTTDDDACLDFNTKHKFSLDTADEEEFLFFHIFNSSYLTGFLSPTCFEQHLDLDMFYADTQPDFRRTKLQEWFVNCLQRQMYSRGTAPPSSAEDSESACDMVLKFPGAITKAHTLSEVFPKARWVYLVRDPLDIIPSALSLAYSYMMFVYGKDNKEMLEPTVRHYTSKIAYERLTRWAKYWYEEVERSNSVDTLVIRFEDMMGDLEGTVDRICKFGGMSLDDETMVEIRKQSASHREKGHSKNNNETLEFFGLNEDTVKKDWAWYMDHYGIEHKTATPVIGADGRSVSPVYRKPTDGTGTPYRKRSDSLCKAEAAAEAATSLTHRPRNAVTAA
eukprot:TRINITY_DN2675_c0_g2_i1.p1 TRINITY_DN2675_c0_g2~~TRINITY_DN2675_c0_g2_i1.p1  ORF type:complete len:504 (-),score=155.92 TRINITY_DN2675_c0_g2_i1:7-1464(-)